MKDALAFLRDGNKVSRIWLDSLPDREAWLRLGIAQCCKSPTNTMTSPGLPTARIEEARKAL